MKFEKTSIQHVKGLFFIILEKGQVLRLGLYHKVVLENGKPVCGNILHFTGLPTGYFRIEVDGAIISSETIKSIEEADDPKKLKKGWVWKILSKLKGGG